MPTELVPTVAAPPSAPAAPTHLPETDGEPLDSPWHRDCINLLIESVEVHRAGRKDFYCGGNMFIYFSAEQARTRDYRGPDFFLVNGAEHDRKRPYWAVWEEGGRYPDVIVEMLSPSTAQEDRTTKFRIYEQTFRTPEYYLYDPYVRALEGWHLGNGDPAQWRYRRVAPDAAGRLRSPGLGLWLGTWTGPYLGHEDTWLRLFDADGRLVPTFGERAEAERQRAEAAEAEIARLRAEIEALRNPPSAPNP
jgi:Uma2 family endonuclease